MTINITGTGEFTDSNTLVMTSGSDFEYETLGTTTGHSLAGYGCAFDRTIGKSTIYTVFLDGHDTDPAGRANITGYNKDLISVGTNGITFYSGGTFSNGVIFCSSHTENQNVTLDVNGSTSAIVVGITGTGEFNDLDDTVMSAGDEIEWEHTGGTGVTIIESALLEWTSDDDDILVMALDSVQRDMLSGDYSFIGGELTDTTTILTRQHNIFNAISIKDYFAHIGSANASADTEFTINIEGSDNSVLQLAINGGTGRFEDVVGTISLTSGDLVTSHCSAGTANAGTDGLGVSLTYPAKSAHSQGIVI